jgi:hypothetical protein
MVGKFVNCVYWAQTATAIRSVAKNSDMRFIGIIFRGCKIRHFLQKEQKNEQFYIEVRYARRE